MAPSIAESLTCFARFWRNRRTVKDTETAARFIFDSGKYAATTGRARDRAFDQPELSVSLIDALPASTIWRLGDVAGEARKKPAAAYAWLPVAEWREIEMSIRCDEPPWRHAIADWPDTNLERCKNLRQQLAAKARLVVRPIRPI